MTAGGGRARRGGSFIPRPLAALEAGGPGRTAVIRAALIVSLLALAIFAILTVRLGGSQVNLRAGDVAQADVRATETVTYQSAIETEQARRAAAAEVPNKHQAIAPRPDIAAEQLNALDGMGRTVATVLADQEAGDLEPANVAAEIRRVAPRLSVEQANAIAVLTGARWQAIVDAARPVLEAAQNGAVREGELEQVEATARANVTADLPDADRSLAGDLVVEFLAPNERIDNAATEAAR